jgi:hypothetical protein
MLAVHSTTEHHRHILVCVISTGRPGESQSGHSAYSASCSVQAGTGNEIEVPETWQKHAERLFGSTSARTSRLRPSGRPRLLCPVRLDSGVVRASSVSRARIRTARFRSASHAARMTRPRLFHTSVPPASSRPFRRLAPASSTIT